MLPQVSFSLLLNNAYKSVYLVKGFRLMKKVVTKRNLKDNSPHADLAYWLNQTPDERVSAVEILRRQYHGGSERLQRVSRVIERT
jgi:hypothetical protein